MPLWSPALGSCPLICCRSWTGIGQDSLFGQSQEGGEVRGTGGTEPRPFPPHHHEPEPRPQPRTLYRRGGACCICTLDCPAGHGHDNEASHLVSCTFNFCPVFLVMQPESGESRAARAEGPQESGFPLLGSVLPVPSPFEIQIKQPSCSSVHILHLQFLLKKIFFLN